MLAERQKAKICSTNAPKFLNKQKKTMRHWSQHQCCRSKKTVHGPKPRACARPQHTIFCQRFTPACPLRRFTHEFRLRPSCTTDADALAPHSCQRSSRTSLPPLHLPPTSFPLRHQTLENILMPAFHSDSSPSGSVSSQQHWLPSMNHFDTAGRGQSCKR